MYSKLSVAQCKRTLVRRGRRRRKRRRRRRRNITVDNDNGHYYYCCYYYSKLILKFKWLLLHVAPHSVCKILAFQPQ